MYSSRMRITGLVMVVVASGCGQLELEDEPEVQTDSTSSAVTGLCGTTRTAIGPVLTTGEVAATRTTNGTYVAWTGTTAQPGSIVRLDPQYRILARWDLGATGPNLNGVLHLGTNVFAAYGTNSFGVVDMMQFTTDLGIWNYFADFAGNPAKKPFLSNPAGTQRAYIWSFRNTLIASHQDETGYASHGSFFDRTGTITQLAGDNGTHDSAVVWIEDLGNGTLRCSAGNIGFDVPTLPSLRSTRVVSNDCRYARIAAGPTDDIQLVVHTTASGSIRAVLRRGGADIVNVLTTSGRAPKVQFDGTRFWLAWRDTGVAALRIASIDPIGTLVRWSTTGPSVAGDEAFDLVRTGTATTALVALTPNSLDFVTLCR
jgi:hypothetical protein